MKLQHITRAEVEAICHIADLAKHYPTNRSKQPPILPSILECADTAALDRAMTTGMPPARINLVRHIQALTPGAITELALLCWLGRGDASIELLRPHAEHTYCPTLPYNLADKPLLGEYLRTGINRLNSKLS